MIKSAIKSAIFASGSGSNLEALVLNAQKDNHLIIFSLIIVDKPDAYAVTRAENLGIPCTIIDRTDFPSKNAFEEAIHETLLENDIKLICLAGFMRVLSANFVKKWENRILNIHPSLLPKYKGLNTHQRAIDAGDAYAGCTVHLVDEGVDTGKILGQQQIKIDKNDDESSLSSKVLKIEHILYWQTVKNYVEKNYTLFVGETKNMLEYKNAPNDKKAVYSGFIKLSKVLTLITFAIVAALFMFLVA